MGYGGVGRHYTGELGEAYFQRWRASADLGARLGSRKFIQHIRASDSILDFGCRSGALLRELGHTGVGVEPNPAARRDAAAHGTHVVETSAEIASGTIDVVISNHAPEHTLSPYAELKELHRVLRSGGHLILWLPLDDWRAGAYRADDPNHHLSAWTPRTIGNLPGEVGFSLETSRVVRHAWPPHAARGSRDYLPALSTWSAQLRASRSAGDSWR